MRPLVDAREGKTGIRRGGRTWLRLWCWLRPPEQDTAVTRLCSTRLDGMRACICMYACMGATKIRGREASASTFRVLSQQPTTPAAQPRDAEPCFPSAVAGYAEPRARSLGVWSAGTISQISLFWSLLWSREMRLRRFSLMRYNTQALHRRICG